jgi:hypothetical protein
MFEIKTNRSYLKKVFSHMIVNFGKSLRGRFFFW